MAAMNLNPFVFSLSFVICCFVSNFLKFVSNIQKLIMKGVIGPKYELISQLRKVQIVM